MFEQSVSLVSAQLSSAQWWIDIVIQRNQFVAVDTFKSLHELQYLPKVLEHFAYFQSGRNIRPPSPLKQCWFLGEVHGVMEKLFVCNNAKCLRYRPEEVKIRTIVKRMPQKAYHLQFHSEYPQHTHIDSNWLCGL